MNAPPSDLDVEDQRVGAFGDLLAHDRRRDQRHAFDRAGHVAQRVQLLVGRRQVGRLSDKHATELPEHRKALGHRHVDPEPRNRLELVDRAAGVPERPAGALRHQRAARGDDGHDDERHLVADAARAVLADLHARQRRQVDALAGPDHGVGQPRGLVGVEAAEHDGHQQGRRLVLGNRAVGDATRPASRSRRVSGGRPRACAK